MLQQSNNAADGGHIVLVTSTSYMDATVCDAVSGAVCW
jgi:hypothetical protein